MKIIENQTFASERDFYGSENIKLINCTFKGIEDGESSFKEAKDIIIESCLWDLRYPFWHDDKLVINNTTLTSNCRAALWYSNDIKVTNSNLHGIKALRECSNISIDNCDIISPEFGWFNNNLKIKNTSAAGEYFVMRSNNLAFENLTLNGKYSFQYIENATFINCNLNTKDAFWHGKNIVVKDSVIKGEYLAWYATDLTFINCKIIGTQPLCYCKNLTLINCEMIDCDLSFEKSSVNATIVNEIISIKKTTTGVIKVKGVKEIIMDDSLAKCEIIVE